MPCFKGLITTIRPKIGMVAIPWAGAMALFAAFNYGNYPEPMYTSMGFYITLLLVVFASFLGVSTSYAINDYFDRDIDKLAFLKGKRKIVMSMDITKNDLVIYSAILGLPSLAIMLYLSPLMFLIGSMQFLSVALYSGVFKRKTPYANSLIVLSTALMPLGIWFAYTNVLTIEAGLLFTVNVFHQSGFTWSATCRDVDADKNLGIKTLPIEFGIKSAAIFITVSWVLHLVAAFALYVLTDLGLIFILMVVPVSIYLIHLGLNFINNPKPHVGGDTFLKSAIWFFVFSFAIIIDVLVGL